MALTPLFLGRLTCNLVGKYIFEVGDVYVYFQVLTCFIFGYIAKTAFLVYFFIYKKSKRKCLES